MKTVMIMQLILLLVLVPVMSAAEEWRPVPGHEKTLSIYVKKEAPIYETKGYGKPKGKFRVGHHFTIPRELQGIWDNNKWLHVTSKRYPKAPFWIETKYLTSEDRLKKVTKDWPVRYLYASGPECMYYLNFKKTGEVDIAICEDKAKGHVYRDGPIVKIPYRSKKYGRTLLVGIDYLDENNQKLYHSATGPGEYLKQGLFTDPKKPVKDPFGKCILDCDRPVAAKFRHKPHASWASSRLYGNDGEYNKLKRVVITENNGKYDVYIENQYGMKCSIYFNETGKPALLQNCYYSGDRPSRLIIDSEKISLQCNMLGNEEVCNGEYKWHDRHGSGKSRLTIARRVK